jgi:hypothetical protein
MEEVSGEIYAPATTPQGKQALVSTRQEAEANPETIR